MRPTDRLSGHIVRGVVEGLRHDRFVHARERRDHRALPHAARAAALHGGERAGVHRRRQPDDHRQDRRQLRRVAGAVHAGAHQPARQAARRRRSTSRPTSSRATSRTLLATRAEQSRLQAATATVATRRSRSPSVTGRRRPSSACPQRARQASRRRSRRAGPPLARLPPQAGGAIGRRAGRVGRARAGDPPNGLAGVAEAGLLHDPLRGAVGRQREADQLAQTELLERYPDALARQLGRQAAGPSELRHDRVADLDLGASVEHDAAQPAAAGERCRLARSCAIQ